MKQVVFFIFLLLTISHLQAQDSIAVNLVNQYKKHLKSKPVRINNIDYTTDKTGHVTIRKPLSDSITITSPGYDEETIAFAETDTQKQVVVNKHFSWTDLLTPMFYILYGGIWL